ncbi:hypothetical protein [Escherichia coli]|nr:hypothetical protein [Escherichia coli]
MSGEKAKYRVLRLSHIHNNLWPEGSEVEYEGEPGTALEPLNDADSADDGLDKLREDYEFLFNEKPHHNAKAETLREKIADKRAELGV